MNEFELKGTLEEDCTSIRLHHGKHLRRVMQNMIGPDLLVKFKKFTRKRSDSQNRWLWGVAYVCISAFIKETEGRVVSKEEVHAITLGVVMERKLVSKEINGCEIAYFEGKTTSQLNTKEFNEMKDKLQAFWSERGCNIPDPNENNLLTDHIKDV